MQQEHGVPFNWYKWDKYVNRHNSEDMLSREAYKALPEAQQKLYKGVRQREIMVLFNIDQTTLPMADAEKYRDCNNASAAVQTGATCKARNDNCAAR